MREEGDSREGKGSRERRGNVWAVVKGRREEGKKRGREYRTEERKRLKESEGKTKDHRKGKKKWEEREGGK